MTATPDQTFSVRLPAVLESSRVARQRLRELLEPVAPTPALLQEADLVLHELVINGVTHGDGEIGVACRLHSGQLCISVHDDGSLGTVAVKPLTDDRPSGRGLAMVDALSRSWTVDRSRGTTVSACLDL